LRRILHGDSRGVLGIDLTYESGHVLAFSLLLDVSVDHPDWIRYNVHLQDSAGRCVFRYDNAPHYPELSTFPDHKHVGQDEQPEPHPRPSLRHVLDEVAQHVTGMMRPEGA